MHPEIYNAVRRMICDYGWGWGMTCSIINRKYGTNYTVKEFKKVFLRHFLPSQK